MFGETSDFFGGGGGGKVEFHITAEKIYPTGGTGVALWSPVGG